MSAATELEEALRPIVRGSLPVRLHAWDGSVAGPPGAPVVHVTSPMALRRLLWAPGELGAAQAYVAGEITVEGDLDVALTHVWSLVAERGLRGVRPTPRTVAHAVRTASRLGVLGPRPTPPDSQSHIKGRLHTRARDRAAISHHYDLSNEFYAAILDDHMAYSSAYFTSDDPAYTLEDAQADKLDLVCRKIGLQPGMSFLDIGCGWGSLSLFAAQRYDAQVTGVTISAEQKRFIDQRIAERGLADRVEIRLCDYRDVSGSYDAAASIEMGEHVGQAHYPDYVEVFRRSLRPGALMLIQQMSRTGRHPGGGPFIESFIAPDMHMRPLGETIGLIEAGGIEVRGVEAMREHYVRTVTAWLERFEARRDHLAALVPQEMLRVWELYLIGGRMAFRDGRMGVDQIVGRRP